VHIIGSQAAERIQGRRKKPEAMTWILCYDIENDRLRQKLARHLEKHGWERLQKSVFAKGQVAKEFNRFLKILKARYEAAMGPSDKIYAWGLGDSAFANAAIIGPAYDARWIQNKYVVMYVGDGDLLK
jgi:CRISPR-associated endonuclease Cas2